MVFEVPKETLSDLWAVKVVEREEPSVLHAFTLRSQLNGESIMQ